MAGTPLTRATEKILEPELTCPLCLTIYREPVSLSCSHCFCKQCITKVLDHQRDEGRSYTCPMCQALYQELPALLKNLQLSNIVDSYLAMQGETDERQIQCDDCLDYPHVAVKTCVTCDVTVCQKHLERHKKKSHVVVELTESVQERKCAEHDKLLEYYCDQENCCICVTCYIAGTHKGHNIVTLKQAHEKHLATLSTLTSDLSSRVSGFTKDIQDLHDGLQTTAENTVRLSKPLEDLCNRIISLVNDQFNEIKQVIITNQAQTTSEMTALVKQMKDAKSATEQALGELNLISKQSDALLFIRDFKRCQELVKQQSSRMDTVQVVAVKAENVMIENIEKETKDYIASLSQYLKYVHNVLSQQTQQLVWSGGQRTEVHKKVCQVKWQKSEKMNLTFQNVNYLHCSYMVTVSNRNTLSATSNASNGYYNGYNTLHKCICNCKLPVVTNSFARNTSSDKAHCLVNVSKADDWCVGVTDNEENARYLQWKDKSLSYVANSALLLENSKINVLKMELDFRANLIGFYDAGCAEEKPILICTLNSLFTKDINVGFNILNGSLSLI